MKNYIWDLHRIWVKHWTDKATHRYLDFYDTILSNMNINSLLEIWVFRWASIGMWKEYLPNARIVWVDISWPIKVDWCEIICADATTTEFAETIWNFDVIVDDGGHLMSQQKNSLNNLWNNLNEWWIFIMEDICTSFMESHIDELPTTYGYILNEFIKKNNVKKYIEFFKEDNKAIAGSVILFK